MHSSYLSSSTFFSDYDGSKTSWLSYPLIVIGLWPLIIGPTVLRRCAGSFGASWLLLPLSSVVMVSSLSLAGSEGSVTWGWSPETVKSIITGRASGSIFIFRSSFCFTVFFVACVFAFFSFKFWRLVRLVLPTFFFNEKLLFLSLDVRAVYPPFWSCCVTVLAERGESALFAGDRRFWRAGAPYSSLPTFNGSFESFLILLLFFTRSA